MTAQEIPPRTMQLDHALTARDAVHHAGADKIGPRAAETAWNADDAGGLFHVFPVTASDTHTIGEMQPVFLGPQVDRRYFLAVPAPLPTSAPSGSQAALPVKPVHVDGAAGIHCVTPQSRRPS